jgi:phage baseplate assembly protein W
MATVEKTQSFKQLTALRDAESINDSTLNSKQYSDLDLFFTKKSSNKDVNALTNITAIKRSVRNLILTNFYEKPFHPEIGSGVRDLLFENATPLTSIAISQSVQDVIENYEPRAIIKNVLVNAQLDRNAYDVQIVFTVLNSPTELIELNVPLEILR